MIAAVFEVALRIFPNVGVSDRLAGATFVSAVGVGWRWGPIDASEGKKKEPG